MRILMLSWEYPPKVVGGLARAVADLSEAITADGHDLRVITSDYPGAKSQDIREGVEVHRVGAHHPHPLNFLDSVLYLNFQLVEKAVELWNSGWHWDVVHAHDWLVAHSAKILKHSCRTPLVTTIHATEWGRNNGLHNDLQRHISDVEWWLCYEAYGVICCSHYMMDELQRVFQVPRDKMVMVPNGVKTERFAEHHPDLPSFRNNHAHPQEDLVFYVGRLVHEKGVHVLLEAIPKVLRRCPQTKFVIAGKGPAEQDLRARCGQLGIATSVHFTGFVDDVERNSLYKTANVAVFPSLYEPFGIVALEAMAAKTPLVVSDIGGFSEIVIHGKNGLTHYAGNSQSLADSIVTLLLAPEFADRLRDQAYRDLLNHYQWDRIAEQTVRVYQQALGMSRRTLSNPIGHRLTPERYELTAGASKGEISP